MNIYPPDEVRQQSLRPETSSAPRLKIMDEMDDIFRRNGYNRKHAYDALFDDSEEVDGESPLRIESPGSWNDDISAITELNTPLYSANRPRLKNKLPTGRSATNALTKQNDKVQMMVVGVYNHSRRKNDGQPHIFGASRFSWQDTDDEETSLEGSVSDGLDKAGKTWPAYCSKTMGTETVTFSSEEPEMPEMVVNRPSRFEGTVSSVTLLQTSGLEPLSTKSPEKKPRKEVPASDSTEELNATSGGISFRNLVLTPLVACSPEKKLRQEGLACDSTEEQDVASVGISFRNLVLTPLAACLSCEPAKFDTFHDDDSPTMNVKTNKTNTSPKKKSPLKATKHDQHTDIAEHVVPSWVTLS
mmetsp:Transcript_28105/g.40234  ORF Transcript_28105/g.40234 Transcript_28105/m.40234 type:complete len:358 (+) Transcript_28105:80-1153(+)|eukprot:CAMPEP_0172421902 /NCGR_PEP_ID=MMETSP1064-20121228/8126_1 /TAXON_ID=202472 /ORGANISM="Aulacoseira subarctica , Strain CCAP 1002/5" /LENGTH=357 /DNA_ID=CAMNT_0013162533 /DNA_START=53 /DNA_END=1126 /DNA_ORIENTATION=-